MSTNNPAFQSLYDAVTHVLSQEHYLSKEGVWVIGQKDAFNPVNVGFNIDCNDVSHLVVKGAYFSLHYNNFNIYTNNYEKNDVEAILPHDVSVQGHIEQENEDHLETRIDERINERIDEHNNNDKLVNLVVDTAKTSDDGNGGDDGSDPFDAGGDDGMKAPPHKEVVLPT